MQTRTRTTAKCTARLWQLCLGWAPAKKQENLLRLDTLSEGISRRPTPIVINTWTRELPMQFASENSLELMRRVDAELLMQSLSPWKSATTENPGDNYPNYPTKRLGGMHWLTPLEMVHGKLASSTAAKPQYPKWNTQTHKFMHNPIGLHRPSWR